MRGTLEGTAHLGGIAAMLQVADICPRCGQDHPEPRVSLRARGPMSCPTVVHGSFPVMPAFDPELEELPPSPASRRIRDFEQPAPATSTAAPTSISWSRRGDDTRSRALAIPWLPLPDLGEVL
ncbi:MAG TPA: hypothetical protein VML53_04605 [Thermoplasmata archaeon]|nr:hypothetical protein [Thermoplasmata archaeon]